MNEFPYRFIIEKGFIIFCGFDELQTEFCRAYLQIQTADSVYQSTNLDWNIIANNRIQPDELDMVMTGSISELGMVIKWRVRQVAENKFECKIMFNLEKDIEVITAFIGLTCSEQYWRWHNSSGFGAVPYVEKPKEIEPLWAGNPRAPGLSVSSGRERYPEIRVMPSTRCSYSSAKIVLHPEKKKPELRYYRIDKHYGPVLLTKGAYTLFTGHIQVEGSNPDIFDWSDQQDVGIASQKTVYPERSRRARNDSRMLVIGINYPAFVNYCIEEFQRKFPATQFDILIEESAQTYFTKDNRNRIITYPNLIETSPIKKLGSWISLWIKLRTIHYHQVWLLHQDVESIPGKYLNLLFAFIRSKSKYLLDPNGNQKTITSGQYLIKIITRSILRKIKTLAKILLIPIDMLLTGIIFLYILLNPRTGRVKEV